MVPRPGVEDHAAGGVGVVEARDRGVMETALVVGHLDVHVVVVAGRVQKARRRQEEARLQVDAEGGGGERAGEGDVAECVAGEHLGPQDDEVADEPAGESDEAAGEERVAHELVREHQPAVATRTST